MADNFKYIDPVSGNITMASEDVAGVHFQKTILTDDTGTTIEPLTDAELRAAATASSATLSNVSSSATSVSLLATNTSRKGVIVFNDCDKVLYLKYGATASATSHTVQIAAGGYWEMPTNCVYTGAIDGIWAASPTGSARITEL